MHYARNARVWATRQADVAEVVIQRLVKAGHGLMSCQLETAELAALALAEFLAAEAIDGAALSDRHQPRAGIGGDARVRPLFKRGHERILREILCNADVAYHARQAGD